MIHLARRAVLVAAVLVAGWAVGTAAGLGVGFIWDAADGAAEFSAAVLALPLGGLVGVLVAAIWGIPMVIRRT